MKSSLRVATIEPFGGNVLSVSPNEEDHRSLASIFNLGALLPLSKTRWQLSRAKTLACAISALEQVEHAVVLCESVLGIHGWKDLLKGTEAMLNPPCLIVTSQIADERLWAEALNLGAYDVLAKPFSPNEVIRAVELAGLRWQRQGRRASLSTVAAAVAS